MVNPQRRSALDAREREQQLALQHRVAGMLDGLLSALPDLSDDSLARYVEHAHPVVAGGQSVAATAAAGYALALVRLDSRKRRQRSPDVAGALARSGKLVAADSRSLPAPVLRARALVADGEAHTSAIAAAASYAHALSSNDLHAAVAVGVDEGASAAGGRVIGWRKEVDPSCCDWCSLVGSERIYRAADSVPFHDRDHCTVSPVLEGDV